jgi:hypothetical protein
MTKSCTSCKEPIDAAATKCPRCQAYQHWYRNPQWITVVFFLPLLLLMFRHSPYSPTAASFSDYKDKVLASVVREEPPSGSAIKRSLLTVRIENRSDKKWQRPHFQIESLDSAGTVLAVEHLEDASLVLSPNSSVMDTLSLRVIPTEMVASHKVTITDLASDRF